MSFTLDPTVPADSETPRNGASRIRTSTSLVLDLMGETGASPVTFALPPFASIDHTTGLATVQNDPLVPAGIATKHYVDVVSTPSNVFTGVAVGTNTITSTLTPAPSSQAALAGFVILLRIANTNTGAVTFNPNGLGGLAIVKNGNIPLAGKELLAGAWVELVYDTTNTNYQLLTPNDPFTVAVSKATDQSVTSSTVLTNDNTLVFPIGVNENWTAEVNGYSTMSVAGGLDVSFNAPIGASIFFNHSGNNAVTTSVGTRLVVTVGGSSATSGFFKYTCNVQNGATPGTIVFQFSQDASDGTATIMKAGSSLVATKVN